MGKHNRERITRLVSDWNDEACLGVIDSLVNIGAEHTVYRANLSCRALSRVWSHDAISHTKLYGIEHLQSAAAAGPTIILCNHFSYYDATATDALLAWEGQEDLANRLLFVAGPKVYQHMFRRVAASCLHTLPVPQSTKLAHTSRMSSRELARQALTSLNAAKRALIEDGLILLLYPEGSRTRNGRMQSFLRGVHRYLGLTEGLHVVPATVVGTDRLMSVDDDERIEASQVALRFLEPLRVGPDGGSREVLATAHGRIATALPADHRPDSVTVPVA